MSACTRKSNPQGSPIRSTRLDGCVAILAIALSGCTSTSPPDCRFPGATLLVPYVGQGHGVALVVARKAVVFDAGPPGQGALAKSLRRAGVDSIEAIYLTHPDLDHRGGLDSLFAAFPVRTLVHGSLDSARRAQTIAWACRRTASGCDTIWHGRSRTHSGSIRVDASWPDSGKIFGDDNDGSLVLRVSQADRGLLLVSGDLDTLGELAATEFVQPVEVLQLGHHGSRTSGHLRFLGKASPRWAIVQYGLDNDYGHPTATALARARAVGAQILDPAKDGEQSIRFDPQGCTE